MEGASAIREQPSFGKRGTRRACHLTFMRSSQLMRFTFRRTEYSLLSSFVCIRRTLNRMLPILLMRVHDPVECFRAVPMRCILP